MTLATKKGGGKATKAVPKYSPVVEVDGSESEELGSPALPVQADEGPVEVSDDENISEDLEEETAEEELG